MDKTNSHECQNISLYKKKKSFRGNFFAQRFFYLFQIWADKLVMKNYWQGCRNSLLRVQGNTFRETFLKKSVKFFNVFGFLMKFLWQRQKKLIRGCQNCNECPEEQSREKNFSKEKVLLSNSFKIPSEIFSSNFGGKSRWSCQNCNLRIFRRFWWKTIFKFLQNISTFFGLCAEANNQFSRKISFRVVTTAIRASRKKLWEKNDFLFENKVFSLKSSLEIEQFLCLFAKFISQVCKKSNLRVERETIGEN